MIWKGSLASSQRLHRHPANGMEFAKYLIDVVALVALVETMIYSEDE
jgi:hypothetical protein